MNTLLFSVGIFIFMISVYGVVMAGGFKLWQIRRGDSGPKEDFVVNDDGWEVIVPRPEQRSTADTQPHRHERSRAA